MKVATVDQKRRLRLPSAQPGECFAVRQLDPDHYELARVIPLPPASRPTVNQLQKTLQSHGLTPKMSWESLRSQTR